MRALLGNPQLQRLWRHASAHLVAIPGMRRLLIVLGLGSFPERMRLDLSPRPHYAFGVYSAAKQAQRLGLDAISVIEFGVAGGSGLVALERIAEQVEADTGVQIAVYGFDSGAGMPAPLDYRDLAHVWGGGFYHMDVELLRGRLTRANLLLGDVAETVPQAVADAAMPPLGFVSFDLDYYSSTKTAFGIFEKPADCRLPRVYCYFDDITGPDFACMTEHFGELLAIREFNEEHDPGKISKVENLWTTRANRAPWNEQIYVFHDFAHPLYATNIMPEGDAFRELPLSG
jgi:hypothetical protein